MKEVRFVSDRQATDSYETWFDPTSN